MILLITQEFLSDIKQRVISGEDFSILAFEESDDEVTKKRGGELGYFTENQIPSSIINVDNINDICFNTKDVKFKIAENSTKDGMHVIQIVKLSEITKKYKIVYLDLDVLPSDETKDFYHNQAKDFLRAAKNKHVDTSFTSFTNEQNQLIREDVNIENMKFNVSTLENSRDIVKWMFNANIGDISDTIYKCGENYVVASLSRINTIGDIDLELVREQIIQKIQLNKKFESIQSKMTNESSLESLAKHSIQILKL